MKFAASLSNAEYAEARKFEAAGLTSISQAVKAFERGETSRINEWRKIIQFRRSINQSNWYEAARALITTCDFHGYETDELDTWLANGDVAYILSKTPQELVDAYCDWVRLAQYTTDEGAP